MQALQKIYIVVQGLFEIGDSIGFDAIYQFKLIREHFAGQAEVRIFCEKFDQSLYPDVAIEPIETLWAEMADPAAIVIYHFCDGWPELERYLIEKRENIIVRWHNNTPPWFVTRQAMHFLERTLRGYASVLQLADNTNCRFWCNSAFTARQLEVLGIHKSRTDVVYPASRYLDRQFGSWESQRGVETGGASILFVGRIVPHKGHNHVILAAAYLKRRLGIPVEVTFPGRVDASISKYQQELIELADALSIDIRLPGEVDSAALEEFYKMANVFVCLSEHEGFGLPIFEAMRTGLPTVAWAGTGMTELLRGHPLTYEKLLPQRFAAAIATLRDPEIRDYVIRWQQQNVCPRYTREVLQTQIASALEPRSSATRVGPVPGPRPYCDARLEQIVADRIGEFSKKIGEEPIYVGRRVAREIPDNFVTLHDISSYEALCAVQNAISQVSVSGARLSEAPVGVFLPAALFSSICGRFSEDYYSCPLNWDSSHLIFGPYTRLDEGTYRIEHQFDLIDLPKDARAGELIVDVVSGQRLLAERVVPPYEWRSGKNIGLEFVQRGHDGVAEFRISARSFSSGTLRFRGTAIAKVEPLMGLIESAARFKRRTP